MEESLDQRSIDLLPDAAVLAVDDVSNLRAIRQLDAPEVPNHIIGVRGRKGADRLCLKLAVGRVAVRGVAVGGEAILVVIATVLGSAGRDPVEPIAVVIVVVVRDIDAIGEYVVKAPDGIVAVRVRGGLSSDG